MDVREIISGYARRLDRRAGAVLLAGLAAVVLGGIVAAVDPRDPPGFALFVGRFHPVVVHFPIALILLAAGLEAAARHVRPLAGLRAAVPFVLGVGAASAVAAVTAGYLLSLDGEYDPVLIGRHKALGITVAVGAIAAFLLSLLVQRRDGAGVRRAYGGVLGVTVAAVLVTGHFGGALTHGPGFLTDYMPAPLRSVVGLATFTGGGPAIVDVDSARVFDDLVRPVLERRCLECHGPAKDRGDLRLDTPEALMAGGDDGEVVVPGEPEESELLRRITLPLEDDDAMPPDGRPPLSIGETELIRWWIAHGASFEAKVAELEEMPTSVQTYLARLVGPREEPRPTIYLLAAPPADPGALDEILRAGIDVRPVAHDLELLQVATVNVREGFSDAELERLAAIRRQITWLDLSRTQVTDAGLALVADMPNLTRLHLNHTAVTDAGLAALAGLEHLEYLNLYGTAVTDAGLAHLERLPALRALYLWQTGVTAEGLTRLEAANPRLQAFRDVAFAAADSTGETRGRGEAGTR